MQPNLELPNERPVEWMPDFTRPHDVTEPLAAGDTAYADYRHGWHIGGLRPHFTSPPVRVTEPLLPYDRARITPGPNGDFEARRW